MKASCVTPGVVGNAGGIAGSIHNPGSEQNTVAVPHLVQHHWCDANGTGGKCTDQAHGQDQLPVGLESHDGIQMIDKQGRRPLGLMIRSPVPAESCHSGPSINYKNMTLLSMLVDGKDKQEHCSYLEPLS